VDAAQLGRGDSDFFDHGGGEHITGLLPSPMLLTLKSAEAPFCVWTGGQKLW
jgi:hypothetical protein